MQRRNFIKNLFVLLGTPGVAIATTHKTLDRQRHILIQQSPIAGFQYHEGEDVWPQLAGEHNAALRVAEQETQPADELAEAMWQAGILHNLPGKSQTWLSRQLPHEVNSLWNAVDNEEAKKLLPAEHRILQAAWLSPYVTKSVNG